MQMKEKNKNKNKKKKKENTKKHRAPLWDLKKSGFPFYHEKYITGIENHVTQGLPGKKWGDFFQVSLQEGHKFLGPPICTSPPPITCFCKQSLNPNLPDPMNFVPFATMRYSIFDVNLMSLTCM